jgi:protein-S-isoprenylcysteine O-methyltransferase Ste14
MLPGDFIWPEMEAGVPVVQEPMRALELKIPPGALVIITAALMWLVSRPAFGLLLPARRVLALGLVVAGVVISALGVVSFRRAGTTVNPIKPETAGSLVVSGIYRRTRNPMYLGFLLGLAGWAVFLSNALAFIFLPVFVLYLNRFQIHPEERALASVFGKDFAAYQSKVRRWL